MLPKDIIFRVFGKDVEDIYINRKEESLVYQQCAQNGVGPKIYGFVEDFRAEQFIPCDVL